MIFIEALVERGAAMPGSAKLNLLRLYRGVGNPCIIGLDQICDVDQREGSAGFPARGLIFMVLIQMKLASDRSTQYPGDECRGFSIP